MTRSGLSSAAREPRDSRPGFAGGRAARRQLRKSGCPPSRMLPNKAVRCRLSYTVKRASKSREEYDGLLRLARCVPAASLHHPGGNLVERNVEPLSPASLLKLRDKRTILTKRRCRPSELALRLIIGIVSRGRCARSRNRLRRALFSKRGPPIESSGNRLALSSEQSSPRSPPRAPPRELDSSAGTR